MSSNKKIPRGSSVSTPNNKFGALAADEVESPGHAERLTTVEHGLRGVVESVNEIKQAMDHLAGILQRLGPQDGVSARVDSESSNARAQPEGPASGAAGVAAAVDAGGKDSHLEAAATAAAQREGEAEAATGGRHERCDAGRRPLVPVAWLDTMVGPCVQSPEWMVDSCVAEPWRLLSRAVGEVVTFQHPVGVDWCRCTGHSKEDERGSDPHRASGVISHCEVTRKLAPMYVESTCNGPGGQFSVFAGPDSESVVNVHAVHGAETSSRTCRVSRAVRSPACGRRSTGMVRRQELKRRSLTGACVAVCNGASCAVCAQSSSM